MMFEPPAKLRDQRCCHLALLDMSERAQQIRTRCFVLVLCAFVLLFGFDAKISVYHQQQNLNPVVSSKLWLGGEQKMGSLESQAAPGLDRLLFCAGLSLFSQVKRSAPRVYRPAPLARPLSLFESQLFLRPPPAFRF